MDYFEFKCIPTHGSQVNGVLIARLGELGFESFVENEEDILAYIPFNGLTDSLRMALKGPEISELITASELNLIKDQNWNAVWESAYEPVRMGNQCLVRAPFHSSDSQVEYEIVIEPKMSFGTAHHETTRLMLKYVLETELHGKSLLDMGSGTAVLAILASMKGAAPVLAIDNDEWAYRNALENVEGNKAGAVEVMLGDASSLKGRSFDIILANINRNILLNDIPAYRLALNSGGFLFISGFYDTDLDMLKEKAKENKLQFLSSQTDNKWTAACFKVVEF
ncbi:MAG: 50S ribosomal protein L11 methyltransferase [Bacteroidales bacterium]|nr:50S ribosomal protein L11 methyltransferase [Bacteroidales bacterium]